MLSELKAQVCAANIELVKAGLVIETWGNASGCDRTSGHMVIKPSGVPYEGMRSDQMVVVDLASGQVVEGDLRPSSDTPTHLELYRAFPGVGGIVHTHSLYATAWAQTGLEMAPFGTTHADYFYGAIPCTRLLNAEETKNDYETNTGRVIVELFRERDPLACPAALVANHAPFTWGPTVADAVHNAVVLEYVVRLAIQTRAILPGAALMPQVLMDKHFFRKHGSGAYYGQSARQL
jgi:L-ribulose-5-phosphate 4-epimerase